MHDNHKDHLLHHALTSVIIHVLLLSIVAIYFTLASSTIATPSSIGPTLSSYPSMVWKECDM